LPARPADARKTLEFALDEAAHAIAEGRDAVQGLRSHALETNDLARAIGSLGEELASPNGVESFVEEEGTPREIQPILQDELYRIAGEAMRNGFRHAKARQIMVSIEYGAREFRLGVRDDGTGIDPKVLGQQGRAGHFGLVGMRERAELIGGGLEVRSQPGSGTQVELRIPASIAYATSPRAVPVDREERRHKRMIRCIKASILLVVLFAASPRAFAIDPDRRLDQLSHTAWTAKSARPVPTGVR
jgi:signal transduction histidine kinase